jgi:hypothetical protein
MAAFLTGFVLGGLAGAFVVSLAAIGRQADERQVVIDQRERSRQEALLEVDHAVAVAAHKAMRGLPVHN